ncbi:MAG: glycosyltransferase [Lapillicoccus sp.]
MATPRTPPPSQPTGLSALRAATHVKHVLVVVPAHNEADTIADCLMSIDRAAVQVDPVGVRVVVVADACTDATIDVVRSLRPRACALEVRVVAMRRVGAVRAAGFAGAPTSSRQWFATTDADSVVPPSWLADQLLSAETHDLFVGTVAVEDWSHRPAGLHRAFAERYQPGPSHRHVHATNLGVRGSVYRRVGGFLDVAAHEDVALVAAGQAAGVAVDWSAAAPVVTSARRSERTPTGFSAYLTRLEARLGSPRPA